MSSRNAEPNVTIYLGTEEVHSGYLYKSPPLSLLKNMKSWKRRFFVLAKTRDGTHELRYYTNDEKDTLIKFIDVSTITTLVSTCPSTHPAHDWICKSFKCSPCSVLCMTAENPKEKIHREYFLIGENSDEAETWFNALLQVQKHNKTKSEPQNNSGEQRRAMSQPLPPNMNDPKSTDNNSHDTEQNGGDRVALLPPKRTSTSADVEMEHDDECDQTLSPSAFKIKLDDSAEESSEATDLTSRKSAASAEESILDCVTKAFNNLKTLQPSNIEKETQSEEICVSLDDLNGVIFTDKAGKPCVSECRQIEATCLLHKGDQILAVNDLLTYTAEDIQLYLRKANKHEVKLTILRCPDSMPFNSDPTLRTQMT